jgi:uncharacterized protein YjbI with pentapeptide repeats
VVLGLLALNSWTGGVCLEPDRAGLTGGLSARGSRIRVAFLDVDLTEVVDEGSVFSECTFSGSAFYVSTHTDAAFVNCTFVNCAFFDATFTRCKLVASMFDRCTFNLTKVVGGDWSFVGPDVRRPG